MDIHVWHGGTESENCKDNQRAFKFEHVTTLFVVCERKFLSDFTSDSSQNEYEYLKKRKRKVKNKNLWEKMYQC